MTHFLEYYLVNSQKLSSPVTRVYFYTKSAPLVVKNRFKKKRYRFPIDYFCHYNPLKWFISSHIHPNDSFSEFWLRASDKTSQRWFSNSFDPNWPLNWPRVQFITANESPDSAQAVHLQTNKFNSSSIRKRFCPFSWSHNDNLSRMLKHFSGKNSRSWGEIFKKKLWKSKKISPNKRKF